MGLLLYYFIILLDRDLSNKDSADENSDPNLTKFERDCVADIEFKVEEKAWNWWVLIVRILILCQMYM